MYSVGSLLGPRWLWIRSSFLSLTTTRRIRGLTSALFVGCLLCGCGPNTTPTAAAPPTQDLGDIVARVDASVLTRSDLEKERMRRGPLVETQQIVDEWIRFQATLTKARAAGYDQDPKLLAQWERFVVGQFQEAALAERREAASSLTEDEVQGYYEEHADDFTEPEAVRASVLFVRSSRQATPDKRQALIAQAGVLRQQATAIDEPGFRELIRQRSDDQTTRYRGGDIGWLTQGATGSHWEPEVLKTALELRQPGDLSPTLETDQGFYLIRLQERRPQTVLPFDEVEDRLHYQLTQQRLLAQQEQFTGEMRAGLDIQVNQQLIDSLTPPTVAPEQSIPRLPGD